MLDVGVFVRCMCVVVCVERGCFFEARVHCGCFYDI